MHGDDMSKIDPVEIYKHGTSFFKAIDQLHDSINRGISGHELGIPIIVLSAFTSEIFLKCLISIEKGVSVRGHDLKGLYDQLTPETQNRIENKWNVIVLTRSDSLNKIEEDTGQPIPRDLMSNLVESRKSFEQVRYIYEPGQDVRALLSDLPIPLRDVILEMRPSWSNI